jgi:hypothetical protein
MRALSLIVIFLVCILTQTDCKRKPLFNKIPKHDIFVDKNITWVDFNEIPGYRKKLGKNENDTMVILTSDKMILITGQYGWLLNDTIILPTSGEFGINYEVLDNKKYSLGLDTTITFGHQQFVKQPRAKFEWWDELISKINGLGKGSVIVSGP